MSETRIIRIPRPRQWHNQQNNGSMGHLRCVRFAMVRAHVTGAGVGL